jgi:GR25 family glycosyltransferase involved in LPS biosynthesis
MYIFIFIFIFLLVLFLSFLYFKFRDTNSHNKNYLDGVNNIYWINLDRSPERRTNMEKMFKNDVFNNKKIVRISGVDGKSPNINSILSNHFVKMKDEFTKTEYSCLLSHLISISKFSESGEDVALIMEDDMTLEYKKFWKKSLVEIMENAPPDWEIIQLCYITNRPVNQLYTYNENGNIYSTGAYLINKKGIRKIKKQQDKYLLATQFGHSADVYLFNLFKTYTYKYPYFIYSYDNSSTIHDDHIKDIHNPSKQKIDKLYSENV